MCNKLTYKELHRQLMYNPWTGDFYWKVSNSNRVKIGFIAGSLNNKTEYIHIRINTAIYKAHRLAWLYVYGYFPENDIDHKDQITYHNWIKNLREVSDQCNMRNKKINRNNTSGIKGVFQIKNKKWTAQIGFNNSNKNLGTYNDFDNAVCARLAGEQCLDWEGCDSNSPAYQYVKENIQ